MPQISQFRPSAPPGGATLPNRAPTTYKSNKWNSKGATSVASQAPEVLSDKHDLETGERKKRLEFWWTGFWMLFFAILFDAAAIVAVFFVVTAWAGWVIEIVGFLVFGLWFLLLGLPIISPKSLANWGGNLVLGESLTVGFWPGFTIGIIITIALVAIEDRTGVKVMAAAALAAGGPKKLPAFPTAGAAAGARPLATGATLATSENAVVAASKNPVTASQQAHFADPSAPFEQGATPAPQANKAPRPNKTLKQNKKPVPPSLVQDEQVITTAPQKTSVDSLVAPGEKGARRSNDSTPFPGKGSPDFGKKTEYQGDPSKKKFLASTGAMSMIPDLGKPPENEGAEPPIYPTGATPPSDIHIN